MIQRKVLSRQTEKGGYPCLEPNNQLKHTTTKVLLLGRTPIVYKSTKPLIYYFIINNFRLRKVTANDNNLIN